MIRSNLFTSFVTAALYWFRAGFSVIPIVPGTKRPAVKWDPWLEGLSTESIQAHWSAHPDHELGFILGDDVLVMDADSPESVAALVELETKHGVKPNLIVNTSRGQHRYYRLAPGTYAKSASYSTEADPECIDSKTGRALDVLPPSTGKTIQTCSIETLGDLVEVDQAFIDAVAEHNGSPPPRTSVSNPCSSPIPNADRSQSMMQLAAMVHALGPDCGYDDWTHVLMAIHHETGGSEAGFQLADEWSSRGVKYCGEDVLRAKWHSFSDYSGRPITVGTIKKLLQEQGVDWLEACAAAEPGFDPCEFEVVEQSAEPIEGAASTAMNILLAYSLTGRLKKLKQDLVEQVRLLDSLTLMGQASVFYAAPNTGKTLLTLHLLIEAIKQGRVDPARVFYINVDDSLNGLVQKLQFAESHGFHMVAEGYQGFQATDFLRILGEVTDKDRVQGVVIILDTLKKFTDLMDKRVSTRFGKVIRRFILRGGTAILLAHTNKKPGADGRPVYAGTSDIVEDVDCAYTIRVISEPGAVEKIVEFENIKRRGDVCQRTVFGYSAADGLSYEELLASVRSIDDDEVAAIQETEERQTDAQSVEVACELIRTGTNNKMALVQAIAQRAGCSRRSAMELLERYTGSDPLTNLWTFDVQARGAKVYRLLDPDEADADGDPVVD